MNHYKKSLYNCRIFDAHEFKEGIILINNDRIEKVIYDLSIEQISAEYDRIDCRGGYVSYGFFDPHVHFRVPGNEEKEDWESGSSAAIHGGFTYVGDMPNNKPAAVDFQTLCLKQGKARSAKVHYGFYVGLTRDNAPQIGSLIAQCRESGINIMGIKAFLGSSTGNLLVEETEVVQQALDTEEIVLFHAEDEALLHASSTFTSLLTHETSRPAEAESSAINKIGRAAADIKKKPQIYICHLSSKKGLDAAMELRKKGYRVVLEATPHHLYFDLESIATVTPAYYKVNPPLRHCNDTDALCQAVTSGIIDCVGTDHAPHQIAEKEGSNPPSGFPGLETAFYALYELSQKGVFSFEKIFTLLTAGYEIFNIKERGKIAPGYFADLTVIVPQQYRFCAAKAFTKAHYSPFDGITSDVMIDTVLVDGKIILENGELKNERNYEI